MDSNSYPPPPSVPGSPPDPEAPPTPETPPAPEVPPAPEAPPAPPAPPAPAPPVPVAPEAPAPGTVPPVAPPPSVPGSPGQPTPEPKKKNKALIIAIVVLAILLLCCGGAALGGWALFSVDSDVTEGTVDEPDIDTEAPAEDAGGDTGGETTAPGGGLPEWTAFQPALADGSIYADPSADQAALADEVTAKVYPDFRVEDVVVEPGGEDADNYYPDIIYVKAALTSDPSARIAYYFWADPEAAASAGVHLGAEQAESYETLAESSDGTSYIYDHENLAGLVGGIRQRDLVEVLAQAEEDFPGYVAFISGMDGESIGIVITRWEVFPDLAEGLAVTYSSAPGGWAVDEVTDW